jgi:hypothetical protein
VNLFFQHGQLGASILSSCPQFLDGQYLNADKKKAVLVQFMNEKCLNVENRNHDQFTVAQRVTRRDTGFHSR